MPIGQIKKTPHNAVFKFKVALEAEQGEQTVAELCQEHGVDSSQIFKWKKALLEHGSKIFNKRAPTLPSIDFDIDYMVF